MPIPRFAADAPSATVADALRAHGCAVIERLAPAELCDRVAAELQPWIDRTPAGADEFAGPNTRRTGALLARSRSAVEMIAHPLVLETVDAILGGEKSRFQLHLTQAISIGPGAAPQAIHRDQWCFNFHPFPADFDVEVSTMWALDEFTVENGATRVIPESHRTTGMPYTDADTEPATMPRGSVLMYLGNTVHGGGANGSDAVRRGVNVDYSLAWLRQEENQYLSVPREVAATLPEAVQQLMGYALGAYALGYIDDVRDPIAVLDPDRTDVSSFSVR